MITIEKEDDSTLPWAGEDFWEGGPWAPVPENPQSFESNEPGQPHIESLVQNIFKESRKISQKFSGFSDGMEAVRKKSGSNSERGGFYSRGRFAMPSSTSRIGA